MNTHWKRWIVLGLMTASFGIIASNANDVQVQSYIVHADSYQIPYKGKERKRHFITRLIPDMGPHSFLKI